MEIKIFLFSRKRNFKRRVLSAFSIEKALLRCKAFMVSGALYEALELVERVLEVSPSNADALWIKGRILYSLKCFEEAIRCIDKALSISPSYDMWCLRGKIFNERGEYHEAVKSFYEALKLNPNGGEARRELEEASRKAGDFLKKIMASEASKNFDSSCDGLYGMKKRENKYAYAQTVISYMKKRGRLKVKLHGSVNLDFFLEKIKPIVDEELRERGLILVVEVLSKDAYKTIIECKAVSIPKSNVKKTRYVKTPPASPSVNLVGNRWLKQEASTLSYPNRLKGKDRSEAIFTESSLFTRCTAEEVEASSTDEQVCEHEWTTAFEVRNFRGDVVAVIKKCKKCGAVIRERS